MESDFHPDSLIEARQILEIAAVRMAAERRTLEDIGDMQAAQRVFINRILDQNHAIEEDLLFHLEVVSAGKNNTLKSLFMKIFPDLYYALNEKKEQERKAALKAIHEHDDIIEHIIEQNEDAAAAAMSVHLGKIEG